MNAPVHSLDLKGSDTISPAHYLFHDRAKLRPSI